MQQNFARHGMLRDANGALIEFDSNRLPFVTVMGEKIYVEIYEIDVPSKSGVCTVYNPSGTEKALVALPGPTISKPKPIEP